MGLAQIPGYAEVRLLQSRWRLSGCVGRGWSSLEIPAEKFVFVVPVGEKWAGSQGGSENCPMWLEDRAFRFSPPQTIRESLFRKSKEVVKEMGSGNELQRQTKRALGA